MAGFFLGGALWALISVDIDRKLYWDCLLGHFLKTIKPKQSSVYDDLRKRKLQMNNNLTAATPICGHQDCNEHTSRPDHPFCYEHYQASQERVIDECPNCLGVYKPAKYPVCRSCAQKGQSSQRTQPGDHRQPQNDDRVWLVHTVVNGYTEHLITIDIAEGDAESVAGKLNNAIGRDAKSDSNPKPTRPETIVENLRKYRQREAKRHNLPAYTILKDETISLIATQQPTDLHQLGNIKGVGPLTIEQHGAAIITIVRGMS